MHRFSKRFGFLATLLALAIGGLYWVSETVAPVYPEAKKRITLLEETASQVEAITLRNSHNRSIDFGVLGVNGFHLWNGGGDIFEAEYIFRSERPLLDSLEYVIVPVSPYVFDNALVAGRSDLRLEVYSAYSRGLEYLSGDAKLFFHATISPVVRVDNWKWVFKRIFESSDVQDEYRDSVGADGWIYNSPTKGHPSSPFELEEKALVRARKHLSIQEQAVEKRPDLCQDAIVAFRHLANIAGPRATLVLYNPPYPDTYEKVIERGECYHGRQQLEKLAQNQEHIVYYDLSSVLPQGKSHIYFLDGDHLNRRGAQIMSAALNDSLRAHVPEY